MIEPARIAARIALLTFLVSSLLAAGLTLKLRAILEPWRDRRLVLVALVLNFVAAPALAVFLVRVIPIERPYAIGLLLLGGAAGAPFLPKLVEGAGGDLGFAVALMTLLTVGTTFFMPFVLPLIVPGLQASPWSIARPLIALILAPLAIGMVWRSWAPASSAVFQPILARLGSLSAVVLIVLLGLLYFDDLLDLLGSGVLAAAAVYIGSLTVAGYLLGGPHDRIRGVLGLGTGARNIGAALVAASESFSEPKVMIMLVASTIVMLILLVPAARWLRAKARS
ncbi:MAG TPA: bile acid:sodium symporter [Terrimicrobiaceae bacterium]|nr:bile acid:sodium symporter [Terrimicrobiaceae bacterium]